MDTVFEWVDVTDRLPEESGDYFCIRWGMPYKPEIMIFNNGYNEYCDNDAPYFDDGIYSMNGCCPRRNMTEEQLHFKTNYGKVTHWFPSPSRLDTD